MACEADPQQPSIPPRLHARNSLPSTQSNVMPYTAVVNANSGFLPWDLPDATRSNSAATSEGSNITLVDDNVYEDAVYKPHKHTWADRLLGVLCIKALKEKKTIKHRRSVQPRPESYASSSLWILPVYVLSTRQDKDKHHIPMEAKCTIDTGNMQGNIVSRKFVQEVLEYPESAFCPLTKEEEFGATGITGHQLIPEGAVYLTWYHKKSTRVFRNMRFLISPNEHCDLVIGARSIQKHRLLDVPNLMAQVAGMDIIDVNETPEDLVEASSSDLKLDIREQIQELTTRIKEAKRKNGKGKDVEIEMYQKKKVKLVKEYEILQDKTLSPLEKEARIKELKAEGEVPPPPKYEEKVIPKTDSSHSTSYQPSNSGPPSANQSVKRTR